MEKTLLDKEFFSNNIGPLPPNICTCTLAKTPHCVQTHSSNALPPFIMRMIYDIKSIIP